MKYHCRATQEASDIGKYWIENWPEDIYKINGVVFVRYHYEFIARDITKNTATWYARIDTRLFDETTEIFEVTS